MNNQKEKAKELISKYVHLAKQTTGANGTIYNSKQCALIAVDEIISSSPSLPILGDGGTYGEDIELSNKYWQEVKKEIEKL
jgi:hypothetical protein